MMADLYICSHGNTKPCDECRALYAYPQSRVVERDGWQQLASPKVCDCGRKVTAQGCVGCNHHPLDCSCFPVGYDHELAIETDKLAIAQQQGSDQHHD
jgi:hypothetical protein